MFRHGRNPFAKKVLQGWTPGFQICPSAEPKMFVGPDLHADVPVSGEMNEKP